MGRLLAIVIFVVVLSLALWRAHRTCPLGSTPTFHAIRLGAVALNVLAGLLQLNVEITSRIYHIPIEQSLWVRAEEFAPLFALVVLLWAPRSESNASRRDALHFAGHDAGRVS